MGAWAYGSVLAAALAIPGLAQAKQEVWRIDNLRTIGGRPVAAEGAPKLIRWKGGKAVQFDGVHDSLFVKGRPLVGTGTFTIEVLIRPDGGQREQRFLHVAETDPERGVDTRAVGDQHDVNNRIMFELRAVEDGFYIDGFLNSRAGSKALIFPDKVHPTGRWYVLTQSYDGSVYRTYVDGVLQGEVATGFAAQGPGNVRIGARMNRESYFKGAIARIRFSDRALQPAEFMTVGK